jgi:peptidoglycan/LPS O-acetylase OafA/YrhL
MMPASTKEFQENKLRFYRPELDLLRFLAFSLVFLHHTISSKYVGRLPLIMNFSEACAVGLQLFFVLSAYLITELMLREHEKTGTVHIRAFFMRRILRIWPLYFAFIGGCMAVNAIFHYGNFAVSAFIAFLLLSGNWYTAIYGFLPNVAGALWSISLEEQYYLIWPFLARAGYKRALWIAAGLFFIIAYCVLVYLGNHLVPVYTVWANSFVEFQFFSIGAVLSLTLHGREIIPPWWMRLVFLALSIASIGIASSHFHVFQNALPVRDLLPGYLLIGIGVVFLFLVFLHLRVPSFCRPFVFLGKISYGLYVFYALAFVAQKSVLSYFGVNGSRNILILASRSMLGFLFCVAFAVISYNFLELPFLRMKRRFYFVRTRDE